MNFFVVLLIFATLLYASAHVPYELTEVDYRGLREIIGATDSPQMMVQYLGDHEALIPGAHFRNLLHDAVRHNRPESLMVLFSRAHDDENDDWKRDVLQQAADHHRFEICDFLLGQDFQPGTLFGEFARPPRQLSVNAFLSDVAQLRELARLHPDKIQLIGPHYRWLQFMTDSQSVLFLIEFIAYCRSISPNYAQHPLYQPSNLLQTALRSAVLDDAGMAQVIDRLVQLGARLEDGPLEAFRQEHPQHILTVHALNAALIFEEDIKEPECNC